MLITTIPERMLQMRYSIKRSISTPANEYTPKALYQIFFASKNVNCEFLKGRKTSLDKNHAQLQARRPYTLRLLQLNLYLFLHPGASIRVRWANLLIAELPALQSMDSRQESN